MSLTKNIAKKVFKGISWQHPILNQILHFSDPFDYIVRAFSGRAHLPPYSKRVRSNGVTKQFGGKRFSLHGQYIRNILKEKIGGGNFK